MLWVDLEKKSLSELVHLSSWLACQLHGSKSRGWYANFSLRNSFENMLSFSEDVCKRSEEKGKGSRVERERPQMMTVILLQAFSECSMTHTRHGRRMFRAPTTMIGS